MHRSKKNVKNKMHMRDIHTKALPLEKLSSFSLNLLEVICPAYNEYCIGGSFRLFSSIYLAIGCVIPANTASILTLAICILSFNKYNRQFSEL